MRLLVQEPWELTEGEATTVVSNLIETPVWLALNPCPLIVTKEPGAPVAWDNETAGVTVKSVSLGWPLAPDARIVRRPPGAEGIVTSAVHAPWESAEAPASIKSSPTVMVILSLGAKPEPLTSREVPGDPLERSRLNLAPRVRVTSGTLPLRVREPEARTVCEPAGREGMIRERVQDPVASAVIPVATESWSTVTEIEVSLAANPTPLAVTEAPGEVFRLSSESRGVIVKVF